MDGKQAVAAIRKYEELLDPRLALTAGRVDNRIPIIAVSATLLESQRIELGVDFDGWMLKPIDFKRMLHILLGISEPEKRNEDGYQRGKWERGGWLNGEFWASWARPQSCAVLTIHLLQFKRTSSLDGQL